MNYGKTETDKETFLRVDRLWSPEATTAERVEALRQPSWQLQQAALWALGAYPDAAAVPAIGDLLDDQDGMDVYGAPDHWEYRHADPTVQEAWRCRFRVKQAACGALGGIGAVAGAGSLGDRWITRLEHYACNPSDDYAVRAEACRALGKLRLPGSREALEKAAADGELCTATEARKALATLDMAM